MQIENQDGLPEIRTPGNALAVRAFDRDAALGSTSPGVLTATPTVVCESGVSITLAPIYLVVKLEEYE